MQLGTRNARRRASVFQDGARIEAMEARLLPTGPTITITLDPLNDLYGDQILSVQAFGDVSRAALGIFDTGASAVTFSATDAESFEPPIPILNPGGASAGAIGGVVIGDVSDPGTIYSDGIHIANLTFDEFGFPLYEISFNRGSLRTPGIQSFVGTLEGSPDLPTITGTPVLVPTAAQKKGVAAFVDMAGAKLGFDPESGIEFTAPDVRFVSPRVSLTPSTDGSTFDPVKIPLIPYGTDNVSDPGLLISEAPNQLIPGVIVTSAADVSRSGNFLLDTGAQISVISTDVAIDLGLDFDHPDTTLDVQGADGNALTVLGYYLHEEILPTVDGGSIHFLNDPVFVLDVADGIDGIVGMNAFNPVSQFLFNPYDPSGASLSVKYLVGYDSSGTGAFSMAGGGRTSLLTSGLPSIAGQLIPGLGLKSVRTTADLSAAARSSTAGLAGGSIDVRLPGDATGLVRLLDGGQVLAMAGLDGGAATLDLPADAAGRSLTVSYSGDGRYLPGSVAWVSPARPVRPRFSGAMGGQGHLTPVLPGAIPATSSAFASTSRIATAPKVAAAAQARVTVRMATPTPTLLSSSRTVPRGPAQGVADPTGPSLD